MTQFVDIADNDENVRIDMIGHAAVDHLKVVGFFVEKDGKKAKRYIKKLQKRFPTIRIIERFDGPINGVETIKVGPPLQ